MTFSTKYLAEAAALLAVAWAIIRWIGRSLLEISGGSRDAEGHRFLETVWKPSRPRPRRTLFEREASRETAATVREDPHEADRGCQGSEGNGARTPGTSTLKPPDP